MNGDRTVDKDRYRYGIGEWYGRSFVSLTAPERREFAAKALEEETRDPVLCIHRGGEPCRKSGHVCALRLYREDGQTGRVTVAPGDMGHLVTICPYRFLQDNFIFRWIGEELLQCPDPVIVREVGFLERAGGAVVEHRATAKREEVARIDNILVHQRTESLAWCALEIQAVYFSGPAMRHEFRAISEHGGRSLPFPTGARRPDYRSSGPKRLMPQLQIKVPSLRRWGKRMVVVVDEAFYASMGQMDTVDHISNSDIAWFVVRYEEAGGRIALQPGFVHLTTLERAVEGLTAGHPVSLETFERRIREKLAAGGAASPASLGLG